MSADGAKPIARRRVTESFICAHGFFISKGTVLDVFPWSPHHGVERVKLVDPYGALVQIMEADQVEDFGEPAGGE